MPQQFADYYWTVAGHSGQVLSSKSNTYVPTSDSGYAAWKDVFGDGPAVGGEAEIWHYVSDLMPAWMFDGTTFSQPGAGQYSKAQLSSYNALVRFTNVDGGMIAAGIPVRTDERSRNFIQGGRMLAEADSTWTTKWLGSDGNIYDVDAAQMIEMSNVVGNHTNQCYLVFDQVNSGITLGNINTIGQIDTAYSGL
jgi:Domain of unknown function (DUF4376)